MKISHLPLSLLLLISIIGCNNKMIGMYQREYNSDSSSNDYDEICGYHSHHPNDTSSSSSDESIGELDNSLYDALLQDNYTEARKIIKHKPELLEQKDEFGYTPLKKASTRGDLKKVKFLLKNKAEIDYSALAAAAENGHIEIVKLFFEKDLSTIINTQNKTGKTVLMRTFEGMFAANKSLLQCIEVPNRMITMASLNPSQNPPTKSTRSSKSTSTNTPKINNYLAIIELLIQHGANVILKNNDGKTVLIMACEENELNLVHFLLDLKADPNGQGCLEKRPTALLACNSVEIASLLLKYGANPNLGNYKDKTPLMRACKNYKSEMVKLLLENKADPTLETTKGDTAFDFAFKITDNYTDLDKLQLLNELQLNELNNCIKLLLQYDPTIVQNPYANELIEYLKDLLDRKNGPETQSLSKSSKN